MRICCGALRLQELCLADPILQFGGEGLRPGLAGPAKEAAVKA